MIKFPVEKIDLFERKVIGWALNETMRTKDTVIASFKMEIINRSLKDKKRLFFDSD